MPGTTTERFVVLYFLKDISQQVREQFTLLSMIKLMVVLKFWISVLLAAVRLSS